MYFPRFLATLVFLRQAWAAACLSCDMNTVIPSENITWCPCHDEFFCAKLLVPLDYQHPELGQAAVALLKYPAQANSSFGPYQGMILLNPGGPGPSGVEQALEYGPTIHQVVGSNFDIIGFDPRGVHNSEPLADCSVPPALERRSIPRMSDDYHLSWIDYGIELGAECAKKIGGPLGAGPHMSTAITARDMLSVVDAFASTPDGQRAAKPSHLLNYYGVSYGTFLGQTFASMFPDRVGNVVLDGVVSPEGYLANYTWSSVTHLDGAISTFFINCYELGPSGCSFYTGSSAKDIHSRFEKSLMQLDVQSGQANSSEVDSALLLLKIALLTTANQPLDNFDVLPDVLVGLEDALSEGTLSSWTDQARELYGDPEVTGSVDVQYTTGVLCSDMENRWYGKTLDDLRPLLADLDEKSIVGDIWIKSMLPCLGWSIEATETFQGPFGGDTETPILFVGNTYDPVTPYDNALAAAPKFKGAQALIIDGLGHTTQATQNLCGMSKLAAYFQAGVLPGDESFCPFEPVTFHLTVNGTLEGMIAEHRLADLVGGSE